MTASDAGPHVRSLLKIHQEAENTRVFLAQLLGQNPDLHGYAGYLAALGRNLTSLDAEIARLDQFGHDQHALAGRPFVPVADPETGDTGHGFLPEPLRDNVRWHAREQAENAYTMAGHYRRVLADVSAHHLDTLGEQWQEILAVAVQLDDQRREYIAAGGDDLAAKAVSKAALAEDTDPMTPAGADT